MANVEVFSPSEVLAGPRWSGAVVSVLADQAAAVDRLPGDPFVDPFFRLAKAFIDGYHSPNSKRAYLSDLRAWWQWCTDAGVHPFDARRHHVDAWMDAMATPTPPTKALGPVSIRRRLSAVSKFYRYGIEAEVLTYSPVEQVKRPKASRETSSIGLSVAELSDLITAAATDSAQSAALVTLLAYNGLRITEALGADVSDYSYQRGHRVLRITRKGGSTSTEPLAAPTVRALDAYLAEEAHPRTGPLFWNVTFDRRLPYPTAFDMIRRLAKVAKIPAAASVTPHSLRHTFVTESLAAGIPLQDVQDAAGHLDPATTRRYDRSRLSHDRHPTYALAAHLQRVQPDRPEGGAPHS